MNETEIWKGEGEECLMFCEQAISFFFVRLFNKIYNFQRYRKISLDHLSFGVIFLCDNFICKKW